LRNSTFSRFDAIPACDGRTDERTDSLTDGRTHAYRLSKAKALCGVKFALSTGSSRRCSGCCESCECRVSRVWRDL